MTEHSEHLAGAYALDAMDRSERHQFERHLASCEQCRHEVAEFRATASELADAISTSPPKELRARVMAEIATTRQVAPAVPERTVDLSEHRRRRPSARLLAVAAAVTVLIVGTVGAIRAGNTADPTEEVVAAADAIRTELEPTTDPLGERIGTLEVVWSPGRDQAVVTGQYLDDAGPGSAYALWFVAGDGSVVPAGLFNPTDGIIHTVLDLADIDASGWGVTIEPDTGSDQPTTEILFLGTI